MTTWADHTQGLIRVRTNSEQVTTKVTAKRGGYVETELMMTFSLAEKIRDLLTEKINEPDSDPA